MIDELTRDFYKFHSIEWVEDLRNKIKVFLEGTPLTKENVEYAITSILNSVDTPSLKYQ